MSESRSSIWLAIKAHFSKSLSANDEEITMLKTHKLDQTEMDKGMIWRRQGWHLKNAIRCQDRQRLNVNSPNVCGS